MPRDAAKDTSSWWPLAVLMVLLGAAPALAYLLNNDFITIVVTRIIILAIAAVGLNFILGFGGMVSLLQAGFFGLGGYVVAGLAFHDFGSEPLFGRSLGTSDLAVSLPVAIAMVALVAGIFGAVSLRTDGAYFIMITLAFNQMLYYFFTALPHYGGYDGLQINSSLTVLGWNVGNRLTIFYVSLGVLLAVVFLLDRLIRSRFGAVIRAASQNERRVVNLGIPPFRYKLVAFIISGSIAGLAGGLWAMSQQFMSPADMSWVRSADFIIMAVLGGMTAVWGPIVGAAVFLILEFWLPSWVFGLAVILIIVFLHGGLVDVWLKVCVLLKRRRDV